MKLFQWETPEEAQSLIVAYDMLVVMDLVERFRSISDHPVNQDRDEMDVLADVIGQKLGTNR